MQVVETDRRGTHRTSSPASTIGVKTLPADAEIPIKEVRKALKEFLESGGERPGSPEWHDWPDNVR